jgi:putative inorganic carbon (hco3(-)) transporter
MRGLILVATLLVTLGIAFAYPYVGVLTWVWFALMNPQDAVYTFQWLPLNLIIAIVALTSWLVSRERKTIPGGVTAIICYALVFWMTFNQFLFGADVSYSITFWDRMWKTFLMGMVVAILTTSKVRFHALMWIVALSLGYWGVKGGLFTIATGGGSRVLGPGNTDLSDNNQFALVIVTLIPILNYLRLHSANRHIRLGLLGATILCIITVIGSYSRGGVIALAFLGAAFWIRAKQKLIYPIAAAVIIIPILHFMPDSFWERMNTINSYQTDTSFEARVDAWMVAWKYAVAHFPFGAGFYALQEAKIYLQYSPTGIPHAAHSIYFQVLGENGFVGLALYLLMIVAALIDCRTVLKRTRNAPELRWANDLARMLQLSLAAFCVGGAALSLAYYDMFVLLIWLSVALKAYTKQEQRKLVPIPAAEPARFVGLAPTAAALEANDPSLAARRGVLDRSG